MPGEGVGITNAGVGEGGASSAPGPSALSPLSSLLSTFPLIFFLLITNPTAAQVTVSVTAPTTPPAIAPVLDELLELDSPEELVDVDPPEEMEVDPAEPDVVGVVISNLASFTKYPNLSAN
ncbi:hypothetical protein FS842_009914 [Serendipita sp. 407]|nr:hypothetical protein FS842_009914 [Serendipita sp. 407]